MSIDKFDYAEPKCVTCGGKEFYYPEKAQVERIPVDRVVEKLDTLLGENDYKSARSLLEYWKKEAEECGDLRGELSILSELTGFYRKVNDKENSETIRPRILSLIEDLGLSDSISGATILLNVATNQKAFGDPIGAIENYKKVLTIYNKYLDKDDTRFGGLYNNFALSIADTGDFKKANEYFEKALSIMEKAENGKLECAITYCNMAVMYITENLLNDEKADLSLDKAYEFLNSDDVVKDGYYAFVADKCASAFSDCGRFIEANILKERAKKIYERN